MRKLLYILLLFGSIVQAQFSPMAGIIASQVEDTNIYEYDFDGTATAYMITDYDMNGLNQSSYLFKGSMTDAVIEKAFLGTNSSTAFYFRYLSGDLLFSLVGAAGSLISQAWTFDSGEHTFVATYDGTNMKIYVDGSEVGTVVDSDFTGHTLSRPLYIGSRAGNSARIHKGTSDVVQVYNRALTPAEVTSLASDTQAVSSGRVANFYDNKGVSDWLDDDNSKTATNQGGVTRALK